MIPANLRVSSARCKATTCQSPLKQGDPLEPLAVGVTYSRRVASSETYVIAFQEIQAWLLFKVGRTPPRGVSSQGCWVGLDFVVLAYPPLGG